LHLAKALFMIFKTKIFPLPGSCEKNSPNYSLQKTLKTVLHPFNKTFNYLSCLQTLQKFLNRKRRMELNHVKKIRSIILSKKLLKCFFIHSIKLSIISPAFKPSKSFSTEKGGWRWGRGEFKNHFNFLFIKKLSEQIFQILS